MQRPFGGGVVHSGFFANAEAVWDDVATCLEAARNGVHISDDAGFPTNGEAKQAESRTDGEEENRGAPLADFYITGPSLGGAIGVLAAARHGRRASRCPAAPGSCQP